jgi:hypothetical protein
MPRPTSDLIILATTITSGEWDRAIPLAAANRSPLSVTTGGGGSIGGHSDPTANAATQRRPNTIPTATDLRRALDDVHNLVDHRYRDNLWLAGKLIGIAQLGDPPRPIIGAVHRCLDLHCRVITPRAAADWMLAKEEPKDSPGPTCCYACETPRPQCASPFRHGLCNQCRNNLTRWQQSDPALSGPAAHQHLHDRMVQAIHAGTVVRPYSPHRPTAPGQEAAS